MRTKRGGECLRQAISRLSVSSASLKCEAIHRVGVNCVTSVVSAGPIRFAQPKMSEKPIEVILMRLLASYLAMPVLVVNTEGTLLFFNEPAEDFLGMRFEETGELPTNIWSTALAATDCD